VELSDIEKYKQRIRTIRSVPGIGLVTGMEIFVELQDMGRVKSSEEIASYIGLTPSEYSTENIYTRGSRGAAIKG
jgi:transposase